MYYTGLTWGSQVGHLRECPIGGPGIEPRMSPYKEPLLPLKYPPIKIHKSGIGTLGVEPRLTRYKQAALTIKLCSHKNHEPSS